jgi:hypothetical protein
LTKTFKGVIEEGSLLYDANLQPQRDSIFLEKDAIQKIYFSGGEICKGIYGCKKLLYAATGQ